MVISVVISGVGRVRSCDGHAARLSLPTCGVLTDREKEDGEAMEVEDVEEEGSAMVGVGMWEDLTVRLLALPTLEPLVRCC